MEEELRELSPFKTQIKTKKERLDQASIIKTLIMH